MPRFATQSKGRTTPVNCRNIESRHTGGGLSGCPATKPHANLYLPFFQPKQSAPGSRISYTSKNDATLTLSTEAGKNYYVWQEVKMGLLMTLSKLSQVSEGEGRKGVMRNTLIQ
ncbi:MULTISPECIES: DUF2846 domain-containing protein [Aeromonas]|uniref:DUF2846 domain-containing protein n=1 Tax=Aeromonas TaxID=642 RepID=UPI001F1F88B4|nr:MULTISPECIES: DUF2846 domain-containing protein [Aeromonas]WKL88979.1 DUF2846 domain-containing protein [Aeromonas caviae]